MISLLEKVMNLLKENDIQIPRILFTSYKDMKLTDQEFILISYLLNTNLVLDPKQICIDLKLELPIVFELISNLESKDILKIETYQNKNIREEALNFDGLYNKLAFLIVNEKKEIEENTNLFDLFEKEFGRTISPMEYEIINGWKEVNFKEELIIAALKEAVYNGVNNLRYIDKILYEWKRKGIHNIEDVERNKLEFKQIRENKQELYDYDWLNDNE